MHGQGLLRPRRTLHLYRSIHQNKDELLRQDSKCIECLSREDLLRSEMGTNSGNLSGIYYEKLLGITK